MRLYFHQLPAHLQSKLSHAYWIHGTPIAVGDTALALIKSAGNKQLALDNSVKVFIDDKSALQALDHHVLSNSLFSEKKLIEVFVMAKCVDAAFKHISQLPPSDDMLIIRSEVAPKSTKGARKDMHFVAIYPPFSNKIMPWLQSMLRMHDLTAPAAICQRLITTAQEDCDVLQQMVQKLFYAYGKGAITADKLHILHEFNNFELFELSTLLLQQQPDKMQTAFSLLQAQQTAPNLILWHITRYIHLMLRLSDLAQSMSMKDALTQEKIPSFKANDYQRALQHWPTEDWHTALSLTQYIDSLIKGVDSTRGHDLLQQLLLSLAQPQTKKLHSLKESVHYHQLIA